MYNMTIAELNIGGLVDMVNTNTGGQFIGMVLIAVFFIIMFSMKRWEFGDVLIIDAMICVLLSAIAAMANFVSYYYPLAFGLIMALGYFAGMFKK